MNVKKIVAFFYIAYTFYVLLVIDSTSLTILSLLPSLLLLWFVYFIFYAGYSWKTRDMKESIKNKVWLFDNNNKKLILISTLSVICSVLAGRYYTGQTPLTLIENFKNGVSMYAEYQSFFVSQNRGSLSILKIPHILMMFYIQAILFYSYSALLAKKSKINKSETLYLIVITLSFVYFGLVRGTNFEFFEIGIMFLYVLLSKFSFLKHKKAVLIFVRAILIIVLLASVYSFTLKLRGYTTFHIISSDVFFNPNGITPIVAPFLSSVVVMLYGYFGHGFNYASVFISDIWFSSMENFVAGLLPIGHLTLLGENLHKIAIEYLDMGVMWQPDNIMTISNFGFIGLIIITFSLGFLAKVTENKGETLSYLMHFMILLQMLSMPVGHFIFTSSSNILILFSLIIYWFWKLLIKKRIKL